jgi:hypothetical protein
MGLLEIELDRQLFTNLVLFLTKQSPIPDPTFEVLGANRLIRRFECTGVHVGESAPGVEPPPGVVPVRAALRVGHASVAELEQTGDAETLSDATGWLLVGLEKRGGQQALAVRLIRMDVAGRPVTERFDRSASARFGRPPLAVFPVPLPAAIGDLPITGAAVFLSDRAATLRLSLAGQDLWGPRADRLVGLEKQWLLRMSPEIFSDLLGLQMAKAISPPPGGTEVISAPSTTWTQTMILRPGQPPEPVGWGVNGEFRLKKRNACGLLGNVDVKVTVRTTLMPVADPATGKVTFWLEITVNADNGSTFDCWVAEGGTVISAFFGGVPLLGIAVPLASLAIVGGAIDDELHDAVSDVDPGGGFVLIDRGNNFTVHQQTIDLDLSDLSEILTLDHAVAGPDGLLLGGPAAPKATFIGLVQHAATFDPPGGTPLRGAWSSGYSCKIGWRASFELTRIHITDPVVALDGSPVPGPGGPLRLPVAVFPTSYVEPAADWTIDLPPTVPDQFVSVVGDLWSYVGPTGTRLMNHEAAHLILHTSAGLRRYPIGRVSQPPAPPSATELVVLKGNCEMLVHRSDDVRWLVDPPEFDYGHDPLRHWRLRLDAVLDTVLVEAVHPDGRVETVAIVGAGPAVVEVVTDQDVELRLSRAGDNAPAARAEVTQQWLLPTAAADLGGVPAGLSVRGDRVETVAPRAVLSLSTGRLAGGPPTTPPASVTLPDGRVAAVHGGRLVVAVPFGGAAVRQLPPDQ